MEKSKCCEECRVKYSSFCIAPTICPCHKPSVEVSKCLIHCIGILDHTCEFNGKKCCKCGEDLSFELSLSDIPENTEVKENEDKYSIIAKILLAKSESEALEDEFIALWDSKKVSLGLGRYSSDITYWWIEKMNSHSQKLVSELKEEYRKETMQAINDIIWNKDGSLKSHEVSDIVSSVMHYFIR